MFEVISVNFYENIKKLINESREHIVTYVNTTMLFTYWNIGKMIVEEQGGDSKAKYGNKLIAELSKQMTFDFGKGLMKEIFDICVSFIYHFQFGTQCVPN